MSEVEIRTMVLGIAVASFANGPGWAQEGVVLREVGERIAARRPDLTAEQMILDAWHDLFMEKKLGWGTISKIPIRRFSISAELVETVNSQGNNEELIDMPAFIDPQRKPTCSCLSMNTLYTGGLRFWPCEAIKTDRRTSNGVGNLTGQMGQVCGAKSLRLSLRDYESDTWPIILQFSLMPDY